MSRFNRRKKHVKAEINLTPLIDLMMTLLAIFMITAPLLTSGIPLNLPKGDGKSIDSPDKTLDIGITGAGQVYIGETPVTNDELLKKVSAIVSENPNIRLMISGDFKADYGQVIEVMALLRAAGFSQVALKTDVQSMNPGKIKRK